MTSVPQLAVETGLAWFFAGVILSQAATLVGLAAEPERRGAAFGILDMTVGLGGLIGQLASGPIADRFGYTAVYDSFAVFSTLLVVGGLASVERIPPRAAEDRFGTPAVRRPLGGSLILLSVTQILVAGTMGQSSIGRSISVHVRGFSYSAITLTGAIGSPVSIGTPLLAAILSDRIGRRWVLIGSFFLTSASLVLLAFSSSLWQFCAFAVLNSFIGVSGAIGPAYVVDIDPSGNVGRNVSFFQSAFWVGCIPGMASTGDAMEKLGTATSMLFVGFLPVLAVVLLLLIRSQPHPGQGGCDYDRRHRWRCRRRPHGTWHRPGFRLRRLSRCSP